MAEYIERGALMQFPIRRDHYYRKNGNKHFINGIESVLEYAENLPASDVAPVVHGRWDRHGSSWYCNRCGIGYRITCGNIPANRHNYCPNCGAKMDGGVDNEAD